MIRSKWDIPYPLKTRKLNGVPIDTDHEFLLQSSFEGVWFWGDWFTQRGVPHAVIELPDSRWAMWKHKHTCRTPQSRRSFSHSGWIKGKFCCGAKS